MQTIKKERERPNQMQRILCPAQSLIRDLSKLYEDQA